MAGASLVSAFGCSGGQPHVGAGTGTSADSVAPLFTSFGPATCHYPIVLEHGFGASNESASIWAFNGVAQDLMAAGHVLVVADEVQPFGTAAARAATMAVTLANVQAQCQTTPGCDPSHVHVIAHSFGGLHSREYLRQHPPANAQADGLPAVLSLTTISTPNYGTNVADTALAAIDVGGPAGAAIADTLSGLFGQTFTSGDLASNPDIVGALHDLSEANAPAFAADHPAVDGVSYFAWAGFSTSQLTRPFDPVGPFPAECQGQVFSVSDGSGTHDHPTIALLTATQAITGHYLSEIANDGMGTIASAQALPGSQFLGCIPADHLAEVGYAPADASDWTGFNYKEFYRYVAAGLAALEPPPSATSPGEDAGTGAPVPSSTDDAGEDGGEDAGEDAQP